MTDISQAAAIRATAVTQRSHRPSQRRCAQEPGAAAAARAALSHVELRESDEPGGSLQFRGYASVTESGYEMYDAFGPYTEIVTAGAFGPTLARAGLDVPLVLDHDSLRRIARTTNGTLALAEDDGGLRVDATLDPADADVAYVVPKMRAGLVDEMSFMFRIVRGTWSPDWETYRVDEVDLHRGDVAIVGYGANPATTAELRAVPSARLALLLDLAIAR